MTGDGQFTFSQAPDGTFFDGSKNREIDNWITMGEQYCGTASTAEAHTTPYTTHQLTEVDNDVNDNDYDDISDNFSDFEWK